MSTIAICIGSTVLIAGLGAWAYAMCTAPLRKAGRDAIAAKLKAIEDEQRRGREAKEWADTKSVTLRILEEAIRTSGDHQFTPHGRVAKHPALNDLCIALKSVPNHGDRLRCLNETVVAQGKLIRELKGQLSEVQKALQLGQPVE
ncbi:DNA ligase [Pseudomonas phage phi15]|uniref:Uncharacterized protein n=1 Tax=Pseudomonas phage phi15 TaxID=988656 RepID=F0V6X4_9CAUD|nr:DNA ligase [Pseudomonas phage phi15]CBZ41986.1 hypothetical protein [Pseudomonas phage phi15]